MNIFKLLFYYYYSHTATSTTKDPSLESLCQISKSAPPIQTIHRQPPSIVAYWVLIYLVIRPSFFFVSSGNSSVEAIDYGAQQIWITDPAFFEEFSSSTFLFPLILIENAALFCCLSPASFISSRNASINLNTESLAVGLKIWALEGAIRTILTPKRVHFPSIGRTLYAGVGLTSQWNWNREFGTSVKMMVDSGATANGPVVDTFPKKDRDGKYLSGRWRSEDGKLSCGYSTFKGRRGTMEDFYDAKTSKINGQTVCMFGVFDGHGGSRAAEYLKQHLFENLMKHPKFMTDTKLAISETYQQTDVDFLDSVRDSYRDDGSTASTAVLVGNHLYVANVGDSRTVISKAGKAIPLSEDHKPNRSDERKRIEDAGGVVMWTGTWRVGGVLAMSRAFGNRMLKQYVVAEPEIQDKEIDEECELLVLASDGLWDVVPNEDAISLALEEEDPEMAAIKLTETAFTCGSTDNITCIVVRFHHDKAADPVNPQV
ncbi:hypothetical protein V6N13_070356 [Hibiscus sabdariffa]